jgi:hypothetical protein
MTTTIEALKVRVMDRYRVVRWKQSQGVLEAQLRGEYRLLMHFNYLDGQRIEVTRKEWIKPK